MKWIRSYVQFDKCVVIFSTFKLFSFLQCEIVTFSVLIWLWNTSIFLSFVVFHYFHLLTYSFFLLFPWLITNFLTQTLIFTYSTTFKKLSTSCSDEIKWFGKWKTTRKEKFWTLKRQMILTLFFKLVYSL